MKIAALQAGKHLKDWELHVIRESGVLRVLQNKQYVPEKGRRPKEHRHGYGQVQLPVLGFDLHSTLTPDMGYPLLDEPFPGVKEGMDQFIARGCCLHVSSASLDFPDQDIDDARCQIIWQWARNNGLPIGFVGPNAEATVRLDDRGICVPPKPDWPALWGLAEKLLAKTYEIGKDGLYKERDDLNPRGRLIDEDEYPDDGDVPQDAPRGFTTPLIDVDLHRTLMNAWGTRRDSKPNPDGVKCMREWYADGYTLQVSCAGWNPALVDDPKFAVDRSAWQRRYLRQWGIPYDRLVTKDDSDVWFDDRVVNYNGSWADADAQIKQRTGPAAAWPSRLVGSIPNAPIK
jgi:hypothetical protein